MRSLSELQRELAANNYQLVLLKNENGKQQAEIKALEGKNAKYQKKEKIKQEIRNRELGQQRILEEKKKELKLSISELLESGKYQEAFDAVIEPKDRNLYLSLLAAGMEEIVKTSSKIFNENTFYTILFQIIENLLPENTEIYAKRLAAGIGALSDQLQDTTDPMEIRTLEIKKLTFYIKAKICMDREQNIVSNIHTLIRILLNAHELSSTNLVNLEWEEAIAQLAVDYQIVLKKLAHSEQLLAFLKKSDVHLNSSAKIFELQTQIQSLEKDIKTKATLLTQQLETNTKQQDLIESQKQQIELSTKDLLEQKTMIEYQREKITSLVSNSLVLEDSLKKQILTVKELQEAHDNEIKKIKEQELQIQSLTTSLKNESAKVETLESNCNALYKALSDQHLYNAMKKITDIKNEVQGHHWEVSFFGGKEVFLREKNHSIRVTHTAQAILGEIEKFDEIEAVPTIQQALTCLNRLKEIAQSGKNHNWVYRFWHQQSVSSLQKYEQYIQSIEDFIVKDPFAAAVAPQ